MAAAVIRARRIHFLCLTVCVSMRVSNVCICNMTEMINFVGFRTLNWKNCVESERKRERHFFFYIFSDTSELFLFCFFLKAKKKKKKKSGWKIRNHIILLISCSADSSHVSSGGGRERQSHSVITTQARLISSQKDKWEE